MRMGPSHMGRMGQRMGRMGHPRLPPPVVPQGAFPGGQAPIWARASSTLYPRPPLCCKR